ncbi:DUF4126 domain-containing protein [Okeania sp.]|uniref:DUF4126 domain-containing protein n=1 Tax=Okeania sp. TaxID=3100323 RepID=UPI002B4B4411|nr:DUF4126 domain-containing protein [Okeania sp.]MEB3340691.1 DUF4126 domain-containing protein [Okeania sp.]
MVEVLAALSASAAAGIRIALPLLLIGLLQNDLWAKVPLLSKVSPQIVVGILVSWSLFEIFASKKLLGQRILNLVQLIFSPIVGTIMSMAIAEATNIKGWLIIVIGVVGGLFALVLQLVQIGYFFRWRGLPFWMILSQDILCICLVIFAFDAPEQGGLIALLLLWLAIRSYQNWYLWYRGKRKRSVSISPQTSDKNFD